MWQIIQGIDLLFRSVLFTFGPKIDFSAEIWIFRKGTSSILIPTFSKRGQFVACKWRRKRSQEEVRNNLTRVFWPDVVITVLSSGFEERETIREDQAKMN